jgi:hypothetical protein
VFFCPPQSRRGDAWDAGADVAADLRGAGGADDTGGVVYARSPRRSKAKAETMTREEKDNDDEEDAGQFQTLDVIALE